MKKSPRMFALVVTLMVVVAAYWFMTRRGTPQPTSNSTTAISPVAASDTTEVMPATTETVSVPPTTATTVPVAVSDAVARLADTLAFVRKGDPFSLALPGGLQVSGTVNVVTLRPDGTRYIGGKLDGWRRASFFFSLADGLPSGNVLIEDDERAFVLTGAADGATSAVWHEKRLDEVICHPLLPDARTTLQPSPDAEAAALTPRGAPAPAYESRPGAPVVVFLCFEGAVIEGTQWNAARTDGEPIVVRPAGFSDSDIFSIWQDVSEDYAPFNINVTTDPAAYARAAPDRRVRCIFTPDSQWYDASERVGGVAYLSVLGLDGDMYPCWAFNTSNTAAAESASHEIGHTFGLLHDGQRQKTANSSEGGEYYYGHGTAPMRWGPIMGSSYGRDVTQWSKCEYANAVNRSGTGNTILSTPQDDIRMIAYYQLPRPPFTTIAPGFVRDNTGDTRATAVPFACSNAYLGTQYGVITSATDANYHRLVISGSHTVWFEARPAYFMDRGYSASNLNIRLDLLDATGAILVTDGTGNIPATYTGDTLSASFSQPLVSGTYYVKVTGCGYRNPVDTGFSNYGSIGLYKLVGSIGAPFADGPVVTVQPSGTALAYTDGTFGLPAFTLTVTATGAAPLTYLWHKDDCPLANTTRTDGAVVSGATSATLSIANPAASDVGGYRVFVTDANGLSIASSVANIAITRPVGPVITAQPVNALSGAQGTLPASITFFVDATSTAPVSYQWFKDGIPLADCGRYSGVTTATLTITDVTDADADAAYTVRVTNAGGYVTSIGASLEIVVPSAIEPADPVVIASRALSLEACGRYGKPAPQSPLTWQCRAPGVSNWTVITADDHYQDVTSARLWIKNVTPGMDGWSFRFIAGGSASGSGTSRPVTLRVFPNLTPSPSGITQPYGLDFYLASADEHFVQKVEMDYITLVSGSSYTIDSGTTKVFVGQPGVAGTLDATGTNARFHAPMGIAFENNRFIVADAENHTIRCVNLSSGAVTTLAGVAGQPGDADGVGAEARFRSPSAVAVSGWNTFYIADTGNHTIRRLTLSDTTATVETVAGSPGQPGLINALGAGARFHSPSGLAVSGYIYVADTGNHAVRRISFTSGTASVATLGADTPGGVTFVSPRGIGVDTWRNLLYVSDADTHAIYASDISSGASGGNGRIFVPIAGAELDADMRDGPAMSARFNTPWGLAVNTNGVSHGELYIADYGNAALRKLTVDGNVVTIALAEKKLAVTIAPEKCFVSSGSGRAALSVTTTRGETLGWRAAMVTGADWARITFGASGTNGGGIYVAYDANPIGGSERIATLNVTPDNTEVSPSTVTIVQVANPGGSGGDSGGSGGGGGAYSLPVLAILIALSLCRVLVRNRERKDET